MKNIVITIGREYGSGGRYIGEKVAEKLGIPFYDKELLDRVSNKNGINYSKAVEYDENKRNSMLEEFNRLSNFGNSFNSTNYQIMINNTIEDIAKSSCVILGRNSNNILKDRNNVINIFIYSNDLEFKIKRKMEIENLSYNDTIKKLKYVDGKRKKYYESLNKNSIWGSRHEYDYLIDSSILGIDRTIEIIVDIYNKYKNMK